MAATCKTNKKTTMVFCHPSDGKVSLFLESLEHQLSRFRISFKDSMEGVDIPFCLTEHRYWETNTAHNSPNEFIDPLGSLWNQAKAGPLRLTGNTLHRSLSSLALRIIAWLKCSM